MKSSKSWWDWDTVYYYTGYGTTPNNQQAWVDPNESADYWFNEKSKKTLFHHYSQNGELASLENLILQIENDKVRQHLLIHELLGQQDINGYTALHLACKYGHKKIIKYLLQPKHMRAEDIQTETKDKDGYNALHFACLYMNDSEVIKLLLSAAGNASFCTKITGDGKKIFKNAHNGWSPLHCAAAGGQDLMVKYLLTQMRLKDVSSCTESFFPINTHLKLNPNVVETTNIKLNAINKNGLSALHLAASKGHLAVVELFLAYYSTLDYPFTSLKIKDMLEIPSDPEILSSLDKNEESTERKLSYSEQITEDGKKNTVLHLAALGGFPKVVEALLKHNPNLLMIKNAEQDTPLHLASTKDTMLELLRVEHCPALDARNSNKDTPLHCAVQNNHYEIVRLLLDTMTKFPILVEKCYLPNSKGQTPLHLSSNDSLSLSLLANLKYHKINFFNAICESRKAVKTNISKKEVSSVPKLQKPINVNNPEYKYNTIDTEGNTILHYASYHGLNGTVKYILTLLSPDFVNKLNEKGYAAIHLAKNDEVALQLLDITAKETLTLTIKSPMSTLFEPKKYCNDAMTLTPTHSPARVHKKLVGNNLLHLIIKKDLIKTIEKLTTEHKTIFEQLINKVDSHNNTPFHLISSAEMGRLLLPYINLDYLCKQNSDGQTLLHRAVQVNIKSSFVEDAGSLHAMYLPVSELLLEKKKDKALLETEGYEACDSFVTELIKKQPDLVSIQDANGVLPIELARTLEMARLLVKYYSKEKLKEVINNYKNDHTQGIGLIISELPPDLIRYAYTIERSNPNKEKALISSPNSEEEVNLGFQEISLTNDTLDDKIFKPSSTHATYNYKEKNSGQKIVTYLYQELAKTKSILKDLNTKSILKDLNKIQEQNSEVDEFVIIGGEQIDKNIDPNKVLFKYANLLYALENIEESIQSYIKLFLKAPEYIPAVLNHLCDTDSRYITDLLTKMKFKGCGPWNKNQVVDKIDDNLLYIFAIANKKHIVTLLFQAEISRDYFDQALRYVISKKDHPLITCLLETLADSDKSDNELWQLARGFLCEAIATEDYTIVNIFLEYMPSNSITLESSNLRVLYHAQSEMMVDKLISKYPSLKKDTKLDQNLDNEHCIPLIANYNFTIRESPSSILYLKKGYILELLDRKQQALEYFLMAKKCFPKHQQSPQDSVEYSNDVVQKLIEAQIEDKKTIVKVSSELSEVEGVVKSNLENYSDHPQAIALKLLEGGWVNIFIQPGENTKIVCTNSNVLAMISSIFFSKGKMISCITLDQTKQEGLPAFIIENLVRMANYQGDFTPARIQDTLVTNQDNTLALSVKHQLMLENESFYSNTKLNKLLTILLPKNVYIAPVIDLHDQDGLIAVIRLVTQELLGEMQTMIIPLHPNERHWSCLIIKQDKDREFTLIYSDATGNPLGSQPNVETIIRCILSLSHKTTFIDLQKQQAKFNDNGAWVIENILSIVREKRENAEEFNQQSVIDRHIQLLQENGIPVQGIREEKRELAPYLSNVKSYDACFTAGRIAYKEGKVEESLNYFTKAAKFYDWQTPLLKIEKTKLEWLPEKACGTIFTKLCQIIENYKSSIIDSKFSVVALRSEASYAALLLGYKQDIIQMIHIDSAGNLLTDKESIVSIIGELIGDIALSIVDIASKVKDTTIECFEGALTQLQQFDCDLFSRDNLRKQLADHLQIGVIGEELELF